MEIKLRSIYKNKYWISGFLFLVFALLAYPKLAFYIKFEFNFILLIIVLPFVVRKSSNKKSIRYGFIAIALFALYPFLNVSSVYFFAFVCALFFIYESQFGKLTSIPFFLVMVVSPVSLFLSEITGFEIRLYLTKIAAHILSLIDKGYTSVGNIIMYRENEFHVDPECMGLKMVLMSLFITLIFISFQQKKKEIRYKFLSIVIALLAAYVLVVVSNLFRIILITLFRSYPNTFSHEFIGILCFIVYVVIPVWYMIKLMPGKKQLEKKDKITKEYSKYYFIFLVALITVQLLFFRFTSPNERMLSKEDISDIKIETINYKVTEEEHNVLKLVNNDFLIYIKPASSFYSADHSPLICWRGSGYKIQKEMITEISGRKIYFNELIQGDDTLYSTWWYDCGDDKTISQFDWRIQNLLFNKKYRLVNVVSDEKEKLFSETEKLLNQKLF